MSTELLADVCSIPTAPFAEQFVVRYVENFVRERPKLKLSRDRSGNLLIERPAKSRRNQPRWIFAAHMDHPGFVARRMIDSRTLDARFHGWVHIDYVRGTKVRFFESDGREIAGKVIGVTADTHDRLTVPASAIVRVNGPVAPGSPGMFDQGAGRVRGTRFYSRGIDDQGGVAAALAMLDDLHAKPAASAAGIGVLLTRAEEDGFIGAVAAVNKPQLLRKSDRIIAIECSAVQPYAPQGKGVIIRVGDKTSIFNSSLTYFLTQAAQDLAKRDKRFKFQRALMPGGTCEASVYDAFGYTAAAVCIALGNYHNMDRAKKKIGPEYINVGDWRDMVKLFIHIAHTAAQYTADNSALRRRISQRYKKLNHLLGRLQ